MMSSNCRKTFRVMLAAAAGVMVMATADIREAAAKVDSVAALLPKSIQEAGVLRIAIPDVGKPLAYKEGAELKGMDPDLAQAVAGVLGLKAELSLIPFAAALTGLQSNKFDVSYGEFYVTAERLKVADFVTNWQDYSSFLVVKSKGYAPTALADVCGHIVGAMAGSAELETLKGAAAKCAGNAATVSAFPSVSNAILALNSGRVDGVLINRGGAQEAIHLDGTLSASGEIGGGPTATAVARTENSAKLLEAIKAAYDHLIQSGEYAKILEKNDTAYGAAKTAVIYKEGSTPPKYGF
ncbi:polar amino acid transport system substrate-binding protein [Angulomicrobium tetraedrale]|uniref:Polar amino acid transport system substrate-binding protein n=1 Tax=Ancylobacter tetraedralis TaxID=217068 RepID=A0A839ZAR0_9HYPH|nr:transporter substrate-binding domain-containing protein [Ancylobacter tetraedralis]MBB3771819.1 polar amino acid transport system substrate-binding protein [Ancylobacter tetraedralis]